MTSTLTLALRARNASPVKSRYQICLIHPFDPRGEKVGGLETYIRDFITFHPADTDLLFIGVDLRGDLKLGEIYNLTFRGRTFEFLPILHYTDQQAREAARTVRTSLTGQFFMALLRHFGPIARLIRARRCSVDLRRVEFSWLPAILRLPFVQMLHGEGVPKLQMDLLLREIFFGPQHRSPLCGRHERQIPLRQSVHYGAAAKDLSATQGQDRHALDLGKYRYLQTTADA